MSRQIVLVAAFFVIITSFGLAQESASTLESPEAGEVRTYDDIEFVWIPPGKFLMGSPPYESDRGSDEAPLHEVTLSKGFWLGKTEVTQAQWERVMGSNPSYFKGAEWPVERVSWVDATEFCVKLSQASGGKYTLPTEAQWEYAARAGSTMAYCYGSSVSPLKSYGWYNGNSGKQTHPVAQKLPNAWGLYDMHGNVQEWCQDWYAQDYYGASPAADPTGPASGAYRPSGSNLLDYPVSSSSRVLRGGSHRTHAKNLRSANRNNDAQEGHDNRNGLRVVRIP
jgi:formylglycine-generating enzyme required for sulfatase activity